ncbi:purine/pyrimidine permease [Selenomonadales bacterium OttesenSCG-928-I06]|nr:purine/pyrimidine permease [Selenomonadales bacterium OttesenSCG-928-I06]
MESKPELIINIDDKISVKQGIVLGLQSVLAMNLYIGPLILAALLALDVEATAYFIAISFFACGLATIYQAGLGIKLPIMQGTSYVPLGAMAAIAKTAGLATAICSAIPAAIILALLGKPFKLISKIAKRFIPAVVAGSAIISIGIALIFIGWHEIFMMPERFTTNIIEAAASAFTLILFIFLGTHRSRAGQICRIGSVIYALVVGTFVATLLGDVNFGPVAEASWISMPKLMPFGMPTFDVVAILTMLFVFLVILVETLGTWYATGAVTNSEITEERLNNGSVGEGMGCLISAIFGGPPVTGYGTNVGIISVTRVGSRWVAIYAGVFLMILGLISKLMYVIAVIPGPVVVGIQMIIGVSVAMVGFRVIAPLGFSDRNVFIVGLTILSTIGAALIPPNILHSLPTLLSYILSSSISAGSLCAVILNVVLPNDKKAVPASETENTLNA